MANIKLLHLCRLFLSPPTSSSFPFFDHVSMLITCLFTVQPALDSSCEGLYLAHGTFVEAILLITKLH